MSMLGWRSCVTDMITGPEMFVFKCKTFVYDPRYTRFHVFWRCEERVRENGWMCFVQLAFLFLQQSEYIYCAEMSRYFCECLFAANNRFRLRNLIKTSSRHLVTFFKTRNSISKSVNHYSMTACLFLMLSSPAWTLPCDVSSCVPKLVKCVQR